jgi:hypothetical protein
MRGAWRRGVEPATEMCPAEKSRELRLRAKFTLAATAFDVRVYTYTMVCLLFRFIRVF